MMIKSCLRLDQLVKEGKIAHYGVSVEKVSEALRAMDYEHLATVQIIYNMFRLKPDEAFFSESEREQRRCNCACSFSEWYANR